MNIHEHQAKEILKDFGVPVSKGIVIFSENDIKKDTKNLDTNKKYVLKAQIHAGGRGKAGGVKLVEGGKELENEAKKMFGKNHTTENQNSKRCGKKLVAIGFDLRLQVLINA